MDTIPDVREPDRRERFVVARKAELAEDSVTQAQVEGVELAVIRHGDAITVFEGRCPHQGTLLSEGSVKDGVLTCRGHGWRFECASGCALGQTGIRLTQFAAFVDGSRVLVDRDEVLAWKSRYVGATMPSPPASARAVRSLAQLPGPKGLPLLGNVHQLHPRQLHLTLEAWCREFGPVYLYRLMSRPFVAIADVNLINQILRERPGTYRRWDAIETITKELGMNGVFSAEGDAWRRQRRLVAQALDPAHLRQFFPMLCKVTERLRKRWSEAASERRAVDIQKDLMLYTVDVTTSLALGHDMNTLECEGGAIQQHLEQILPMLNRRINAPFPYWHYFRLPADRSLDHAVTQLNRIVGELIRDSRARSAQSADPLAHSANFLEALIAAQDDGYAPLTDQEVLANVFTILLAGEDTTANTIAWLSYFMCRHPDVQKRMQEEVDAVLGEAAILENIVHTDQLVYLDAVVNETMCLKPVAPVLGVEPNHDVRVGDIEIPKGAVIALLTRYQGLQDGGSATAQVFDPDRWLSGADAATRHRAGFVPFGSGPRLCPGRSLALLEIRCALAMICRNFDLSESEGVGEVEEVFAFSMTPGNLRVNFSARH
jgi:cytochrome P450/nitrite reductase/ring-hydroxylating ferredoxin subunit